MTTTRKRTRAKPQSLPSKLVTPDSEKDGADPGDEGQRSAGPDPMLTGYQFQVEKGSTPYDHMPNEDGLRGNARTKPSGMIRHDLSNGIPDYATLPPLAIWRRGIWFDELTKKQQEAFPTVRGPEERSSWIVPGEGTPGNYLFRVYLCPDEIADRPFPHHPIMWPQKLKQAAPPARMGFSQPTPLPPATSLPPVQRAPSLPANIRFRCSCGHWWKEFDLPKHKMNCCPADNANGESDWAIMCECCTTLDEVSRCKPGFPRPKAVSTDKKEVAESTEPATT